MSDAEAKREARRRRILERGGDRLSRITNTGRGSDYDVLDATPVPPKPQSSARAEPADGPADAAPAIGGEGAPGGEDALSAMLASLQGQRGDAPTRGEDPMAMMSRLLGGGMEAASTPTAAPAVPEATAADLRRTEQFDRRLRLVQATIVLVFAAYVVVGSILSPTAETGLTGRALEGDAAHAFARHAFYEQWASLARRPTAINAWLSGSDPAVMPWGALRTPFDWLQPHLGKYVPLNTERLPAWPVFWVFLSMEMALQGVRVVMLQRLPAAPATGVGHVLSLYAPGLVPYVTPLLSAVSLGGALLDDLCILLFVIGVGVLYCNWRVSGGAPV